MKIKLPVYVLVGKSHNLCEGVVDVFVDRDEALMSAIILSNGFSGSEFIVRDGEVEVELGSCEV